MNLDSLAGQLTVSVPVAGQALGIGKDASYAAAKRGEIPTLRLGRTLRVPVAKLLQLLGATPDISAGPAPTGPNTTTEPVEGAYTHGDTSTLRAV